MEDRPTSSAVKHMIEAASSEAGERTAGAIMPLWDSVKVGLWLALVLCEGTGQVQGGSQHLVVEALALIQSLEWAKALPFPAWPCL